MKTILSFLFLLFFINTYAQYQCGTVLSDTMIEELRAYQLLPKANFKKLNSNSIVKNIPVQIHVVGKDDGSGYLSTKKVLETLCDINTRFQSANMSFYLYDAINYIPQSSFYDQDEFQYAIDMMQRNNVDIDNVVNLYFINSIAGATSGIIAGYFLPGIDGIAVVKNEAGTGKTVLAHEFGHYFGLPHTFGTSSAPKELVDGSNCTIAGDYFCDTPADPNDFPWNCPYSDTIKDANGDTYNPDPGFYMSYASDFCKYKFSQEQMDYMNYYLNNSRPDLANLDSIDKTLLAQTTLVLPNDNAFGIDYIVDFQWLAVAGAEYYNLLVARDFGFQNILLDVNWNGTNFVAELEADSLYFWKVVPYAEGNTCTNYTVANKLETGSNAGNNIPSLNEFAGTFDVKTFPNPVTENFVYLDIASSVDTDIDIYYYNLLGKQLGTETISVLQNEKSQHKMMIENLIKGIYWLKFVNTSTEEVVLRKMIIMNQ